MAAVAEGSLPFLVVLTLLLVGVVVALYTRKGSGVDHHPYRHIHGGAPAAALPCGDYSGSDRTFALERDVARSWRNARAAESLDSLEARLADARALRRHQRPRRDGPARLPIRSPIPPLR
jgi:hypothetical protein